MVHPSGLQCHGSMVSSLSSQSVRLRFTDVRPRTFWNRVQPREYGFWANVNPNVPHARWSQSTERVLGTNIRVPTRLFNGYAEFVRQLYDELAGERLFT